MSLLLLLRPSPTGDPNDVPGTVCLDVGIFLAELRLGFPMASLDVASAAAELRVGTPAATLDVRAPRARLTLEDPCR